eukprot:scaffold458908_cov30-Prasinocladus_malaysianus.AAC.1
MMQNFLTAFQSQRLHDNAQNIHKGLPAPEHVEHQPHLPGRALGSSTEVDALGGQPATPVKVFTSLPGYARLPVSYLLKVDVIMKILQTPAFTVPSPEELADLSSLMGQGLPGLGHYEQTSMRGMAAGQMSSGWQQVQSVLVGLEEELRQLDLQYNDLL